MPIYEYQCEDCGSKFEKLVRRTSESNSQECPSCGKNHLAMELSTFAAHANGSPSSFTPAANHMGGGCPAGMCQTPGLCGRNN